MPTVGARWVTASLRVAPRGPPWAEATPTVRPLFLNINDDGGLAQFLGEALVLPTESLHFFFPRIPFGLGTSLVRGQALENAGLALATPSDEVRRVKAFTALQGADGTRMSGGGIGLSQNPQFVLGGEGSAPGIRDHLRVWSRRAGRFGRDGLACRCTPVVLTSLVLPTFSGRPNRGRSRRYSVVLHIDPCSRPAQ